MARKKRLEALLEQIELKFSRGSSSNWKNRDFEDLAFEIGKSTKTIISTLTLKRIFGKIKTDADYLPQKATLRALEEYAGFQIAEQQQFTINPEQVQNIKKTSGTNHQQKKRKNRNWITITLGSILLITLLYYTITQQKAVKTTPKGKITLQKADGANPKTVIFEYTTPNNADSFFIWFDETFKPIHAPNGEKQRITYYFQYPGLYNVRMTDKTNSISDTIPIYVQTKGWQALGYYFDQEYTKRYYPIDIKKCVHNGIFHPAKQDLYLSGMDTAKITVVRFDNYRPTGINGDNFLLQTTLKNPDEWIGARCNSIFLFIEGRKGTIRFRFANPGCSYWIDYELSERKITNNDHDLSPFTFDMDLWQTYKIENINKTIKVYLNNKIRFTDSYKNSIGEIIGASIQFHGNGYIKNYSLTNKQHQPIFTFQP